MAHVKSAVGDLASLGLGFGAQSVPHQLHGTRVKSRAEIMQFSKGTQDPEPRWLEPV
jgi:hypothetical protein